MKRKLTRDTQNQLLGGVSSGIANYIGWDANIVRLLWVALFFISAGTIPFIYLIMWILMPKASTPTPVANEQGDTVVSSQSSGNGCLSVFLRLCFALFILFFVFIGAMILFSLLILGISVVGGIVSGAVTPETVEAWTNSLSQF